MRCGCGSCASVTPLVSNPHTLAGPASKLPDPQFHLLQKKDIVCIPPAKLCQRLKEMTYTPPFVLCLLGSMASVRGSLVNTVAVVARAHLGKCKASQGHQGFSSESGQLPEP